MRDVVSGCMHGCMYMCVNICVGEGDMCIIYVLLPSEISVSTFIKVLHQMINVIRIR